MCSRLCESSFKVQNCLYFLTGEFNEDIRNYCTEIISKSSNEEIIIYLPVILNGIKYAKNIKSPLIKLLIDTSLKDKKIYNYVYWYLNALSHGKYKNIYSYILQNIILKCPNELNINNIINTYHFFNGINKGNKNDIKNTVSKEFRFC